MPLTLKSEETKARVETTYDADTKIARCVHHSNNKAAKASYLLTWGIDLSTMTDDEIIGEAVKNLKITIRRGFTESKNPKAKDWDHVTFVGKDFVTTRKTKSEKAKDTLGAMSNEEILAYLETRQ